jgi:hypothetical protein
VDAKFEDTGKKLRRDAINERIAREQVQLASLEGFELGLQGVYIFLYLRDLWE